MAELRRGVGKTVAQTPALWPYVIRRDAGTRTEQANDASENATHIALTLWALHSQGSGPTANREDMSFGRAMNELHAIVGGDTVPAHFASLLAARNDIVRERHLRSLVGLMRAKGIGFDYPALAADLADLHGRTSSDRVKRHWARSYASAFPLSTPYPTDAQE
jgi:CRISPR system Cascade subunit CasB